MDFEAKDRGLFDMCSDEDYYNYMCEQERNRQLAEESYYQMLQDNAEHSVGAE